MAMPESNARFPQGFDFFRWEAPYYETPEKVVAALYAAGAQGKDLEYIHVPGLGANLDRECYYQEGKHPFCLWFYDPLQLVFRDGTTMEILPMSNGGARVGVNSFPVGIDSAVNHTTWKLKSLLSLTLFRLKLLNRSTFSVEHAQRSTYCAESGMQKGYLNRKWKENILRIYLNHNMMLEMYTEDRGLHGPTMYRLRILENAQEVQILSKYWMSAKNKGCSVELVPGVGRSSDVKFLPVYSNTPKRDTWISRKNYQANYALSMDVDDCSSFFGTVLRKYFDPAVQSKNEWDYDTPHFDWYGVNMYTMDTAARMIAEIRETADRLERNPDDPELQTLADGFCVMEVASNQEYYSGIEEEEVRRRNIRVAVDLYRRFAYSLESMLEAASRDGCDAMEICGP